ncbi:MAG TPA: phosphoenolpyruvate carboxylase [Streptosporangiaceae bacterium]|jgi:phosphoenolpyruvate carboxylase
MDRQQVPGRMRHDVRLLGDLLGEVLREYGGEDLLADVERLRHAVIEVRRSGGPDAGDQIAALVASWPLDRAELVARAFTVYFHLANLAEEHQRIRTLLERATGQTPLRESLALAVTRIRDTGGEAGASQLTTLLAGLRVHPVLTAHPTEARRRAVTAALRRIGDLLDHIPPADDRSEPSPEVRRRLREEIDLLWRTSQLRVKAMEPADEVRTVMAAFDATLFRVVPLLYRSLDHVLTGPDCGAVPAAAPAFLRFGSWVGADRDGNPFVTAQVTRETALIQAEHALRALETATERVGRALTVDAGTTPPAPALARALAVAQAAHPEVLAEISARSPQEPYRTYLLFSSVRLRSTRQRNADLAYAGPDEFLADLRLVQDSLAAAGAARQAYGELQHVIWQAQTFGFHLAELEVRQHSEVHARALAEVKAGGELSEQTREVLGTFQVIAWIQARFGERACRRYVVSFTRSAADIATVYELARWAVPDGQPPALAVVPLFESGEDLDNSVAVLDEMVKLEPVARRLEAGPRALEVMLGYSDSAKDLGPVSATLRLYRTQARLAAWATANDVALTLFHGRGGALGRGGGPAGRAVLAQAPGSVSGRFKVTEQGEVIFARYGRLAIAHRHLEQVTSAVLLASAPDVAPASVDAAPEGATPAGEPLPAEVGEIAERVEAAALRTYRTLVNADGFAEWFARISPLGEIGGLRIGSRPARRNASAATGLADLRAIPWVFAWAQTRVNLPGWFGLGTGLAAVADGPGGLDALRQAYRQWPLLAVLLDNAEMSLAKTDRRIAERYLALGGRPDLSALVLAEHDLATRLVLAVTGHDRLLADRRVLSRAVALRDPYVDALSYLQLRALAALRDPEAEGSPDRDRLERLLLLTVNGVAAGLQNTG